MATHFSGDGLLRKTVVGLFLAVGSMVASQRALGQPAPLYDIGFLSPASASSLAPRVDAFTQGLHDLGYVRGRTIHIEFRWAEGRGDRLPQLAMELVGRNVSMIVTHGLLATLAARKASASIPIVCFACGELVSTGLVRSLAQPGGTITGITLIHPDMSAKRLELLRQILPKLRRIAVLYNASNPVSKPELESTLEAGRLLELVVLPVGVRNPSEFQSAFSSMRREKAEAVTVLSDAMFFGRRKEIAELAIAQHLPAISWSGDFAKAGMLIGYGPDAIAAARQAATYVDRIIKGAKPADMPVQQPTKFELAVNLRTAKSLGLTIPSELLVRADEVIE